MVWGRRAATAGKGLSLPDSVPRPRPCRRGRPFPARVTLRARATPDHGAVHRARRPCRNRAMQREDERATAGRMSGRLPCGRLPCGWLPPVWPWLPPVSAMCPYMSAAICRYMPLYPAISRYIPLYPAISRLKLISCPRAEEFCPRRWAERADGRRRSLCRERWKVARRRYAFEWLRCERHDESRSSGASGGRCRLARRIASVPSPCNEMPGRRRRGTWGGHISAVSTAFPAMSRLRTVSAGGPHRRAARGLPGGTHLTEPRG